MKQMITVFCCLLVAGLLYGYTHASKSAPLSEKSVVYGSFSYDSVVAFDVQLEMEQYTIVKDSGIIKQRCKKRRKLSETQIIELHSALNSKSTYGAAWAACFEPHLAFIYFKRGKVVAEVMVCFDCNYLRSSPDIKSAVAAKFPGFSDLGKKRLGGLCNQFNFSNCN